MNDATLWWLLAGVLVAAELGTGSFYLLMLALGAAAGALAAHLGGQVPAQLLAAALAGGLSTYGWYLRRKRQAPLQTPIESDRDVNLDIGETVQVAQWDELGQTQVHYRGALWQARHSGPQQPQNGAHRIVALRGNVLELQHL